MGGLEIESKVTKSYLGDLALAEETLEGTEKAVEVGKTKSAWIQTASRWLSRKRGLPGKGGSQAPPRKKRKKAYQWGVAVNDLLLSVSGVTLQHFVAPVGAGRNDTETADIYKWPFLGISADQGPDGFCCSWYLRSMNMNVDFWWDPSHQTWRDQESACRVVGLKAFSYIVCAVLNMGHSPFDTQSRFAQMKESTTEYLDSVAMSCPLLEHFQPLILQDWGMTDVDGMRRHEFVEHLRSEWSTHYVGTTVKMCRFANWVDASAKFDRSFHWTLLRVLYLGLQSSAFDPDKLEKAIAKVDLPKGSAEERKSVSSGNECLKSFREANKNLLQLACQVLSDPMTQSLCRILSGIVSPVRKAYGELAQRLRSTHEMRSWCLEFARGSWWAPLADTLRLLSDSSMLEHIKLNVDIAMNDLQVSSDDPRVALNDQIGAVACRYALALVGARCCRMSFMWAGWTGMQALFTSDKEEEVTFAAQLLLNQADALEVAASRTETFWKKMVGRSPLKHAPVQQLIRMLRHSGNVVDEAMRGVVMDRLSGIGQSKCAEDAFNIGRRLEQSASNKSALPPWRIWQALIDKGLSNTLYKYDEPAWRHLELPQGEHDEWAEHLFDIRFSDAPVWMKRIVGTTDRTDWYSTSPIGASVLQADLQVLLLAWKSNCWAEVARGCAWSMLARGKDLLIQDPVTERWFFGLCDVQGVAALGWPAKVELQGGEPVVASFDFDAGPTWLVITTCEWRAATCVWLSPWSQALHGIASPRDAKAMPRMLAHLPRKPTTLIKEACRRAFWDFGLNAMKWICAQSGVELPRRPTLFTTLQAALTHHLSELGDSDVLDILQQRITQHEGVLDLGLVDSNFADLIEEQDRKDFSGEVAHSKAMQEEVMKFNGEWLAQAKRVRSRVSVAPSEASAFKTSGQQRSFRQCRFLPDREISLEEAQELAPWPMKVYEDAINGRWQGHWKGIGSASRSFHLYGHAEACRQILEWGWQHALRRQALPVSACPVVGIFSEEKATSNAASIASGSGQASSSKP